MTYKKYNMQKKSSYIKLTISDSTLFNAKGLYIVRHLVNT